MQINLARNVSITRKGGSLTAVVQGVELRQVGSDYAGKMINPALADSDSILRRKAEGFVTSTSNGTIDLGPMRIGSAGGVFCIDAKRIPFELATDDGGLSHEDRLARVLHQFGGEISHYVPVEDRDSDAPRRWSVLDGGAAGIGDYPIRSAKDILVHAYEEAFGEIGLSVYRPGFGHGRIWHDFYELGEERERINQTIVSWWEQAYPLAMPPAIDMWMSQVYRMPLPDRLVIENLGELADVCLAFELDNASLECLIKTQLTFPQGLPPNSRLRFWDLEMAGKKPLRRRIGLVLVGDDGHRAGIIYFRDGQYDTKSHMESAWGCNTISPVTEKFTAIRSMFLSSKSMK